MLVAERLIELSHWMLAQPRPPSDYAAATYAKQTFGISRGQSTEYVTRAKKQLTLWGNRHPTEVRAECMSQLEVLIRDEKTNPGVKVKAIAWKARISGAEAPQRLEVAAIHVDAAAKARSIDWSRYSELMSSPTVQPTIDISTAPEQEPYAIKALPPVTVPAEDAAQPNPPSATSQTPQ